MKLTRVLKENDKKMQENKHHFQREYVFILLYRLIWKGNMSQKLTSYNIITNSYYKLKFKKYKTMPNSI